jgi:hypothetical protein
MGILKKMKDMTDMVNAAPGMVAQAQQMGAQAQQMAAAQQAAMQAQMAQAGGVHGGGMQAGADLTGPDFEPVAGVSLDQFAAVSKAIAAFSYDTAKLPEIAASKGIPAFTWETASQGWNDRIKQNPAVARRFNQLYRES